MPEAKAVPNDVEFLFPVLVPFRAQILMLVLGGRSILGSFFFFFLSFLTFGVVYETPQSP